MVTNATPVSYKCDNCGKEYKNAQGLRMHQMHEKKAQAPEASKPVEPTADYSAYKQLPPPVVSHLEKTWGNWLNHIEVRKTEWRKDFGGEAIEINVPKQFSSEWQEIFVTKYDNQMRTKISEEKTWNKDIRICSLVDVQNAIKWLDKVKDHIIDNAFKKGLILPTTNISYEAPNKSLEDYKRELAGV